MNEAPGAAGMSEALCTMVAGEVLSSPSSCVLPGQMRIWQEETLESVFRTTPSLPALFDDATDARGHRSFGVD